MPQPSSRESRSPGPAVALRPIGAGDRDLLFAWANDTGTRAASFHPAPIDPATHEAWFAHRLVALDGRTWIGEQDGRPVGQVRVDREASGRGEVGISVAPQVRGLGLARPLLLAGIEAAIRELGATAFVALARPDNVASLRLFGGAGFRDEGAGERAGIVCRVLVLERGAAGG